MILAIAIMFMIVFIATFIIMFMIVFTATFIVMLAVRFKKGHPDHSMCWTRHGEDGFYSVVDAHNHFR